MTPLVAAVSISLSGVNAITLDCPSLPISLFTIGSSKWSSKTTRNFRQASTTSLCCQHPFLYTYRCWDGYISIQCHSTDGHWYMDNGTTSHMTTFQVTLLSYFNMNNLNRNIIVGSGQRIPIWGYGQSSISLPHPPLHFKNVLHASKLIKNLIFVCCLTTDNNVSI